MCSLFHDKRGGPPPSPWPSTGLPLLLERSIGFIANTLPPQRSSVTDLPIANYSPLSRTADGGETWQKVSVPIPATVASGRSYYSLPTFSEGVGLPPVAVFSNNSANIVFYLSYNDGESWKEVSEVTSQSDASLGGQSNWDGKWPAVSVAVPGTWWVVGGVLPQNIIALPAISNTADRSSCSSLRSGLDGIGHRHRHLPPHL
jgi:hypothetical protein